jgi:hypothetical protein
METIVHNVGDLGESGRFAATFQTGAMSMPA